MLPRHKSRSVHNGLDSAGVKSHGENVIAGCALPCAILVKRLERANGLISFRRFAQFSRAFFCPAPQSPTLIARGELGWKHSSLPLETDFPPARKGAISAALAQAPAAWRVPHPGARRGREGEVSRLEASPRRRGGLQPRG